MPARPPPWRTPRIFEIYPGLTKEPPQVRKSGTVTSIRWTNTADGPPEVVLIFNAAGPVEWDYTIRDVGFGFLRHHSGPYGDPDKDPWTDVSLD